MSLKQVRYRLSDEELVVDDGVRFELNEMGDGFVAPLAQATEVGLTSLRGALERFAVSHRRNTSQLGLADVAPEQLDELAPLEPVQLLWKRGELLVELEVVSDAQPVPQHEFVAALATTLARRRARVADVVVSEFPRYWTVGVEIAFPIRGRSVADAVELGHDCELLLGAVMSGEIDVGAAAELVKSGRAELLVGIYESDWLEAKAAPYLDSTTGEMELAKDVAALANAGGGLILIGLKTKRDARGDRIKVVNECVLEEVSRRRYRAVIRRRITPRCWA